MNRDRYKKRRNCSVLTRLTIVARMCWKRIENVSQKWIGLGRWFVEGWRLVRPDLARTFCVLLGPTSNDIGSVFKYFFTYKLFAFWTKSKTRTKIKINKWHILFGSQDSENDTTAETNKRRKIQKRIPRDIQYEAIDTFQNCYVKCGLLTE